MNQQAAAKKLTMKREWRGYINGVYRVLRVGDTVVGFPWRAGVWRVPGIGFFHDQEIGA